MPWSLSPLHWVDYIKPQRKQTLLLLISLITLVYMTVIFLTISVAVQTYTKMSQDWQTSNSNFNERLLMIINNPFMEAERSEFFSAIKIKGQKLSYRLLRHAERSEFFSAIKNLKWQNCHTDFYVMSCHSGETRTKLTIRQQFWWPNVRETVHNFNTK